MASRVNKKIDMWGGKCYSGPHKVRVKFQIKTGGYFIKFTQLYSSDKKYGWNWVISQCKKYNYVFNLASETYSMTESLGDRVPY